jgi:hypothetical protein
MPHTQFVEVGRAVLIAYALLVDELAIIADIVDDKRVLIDLIDVPDAGQDNRLQRIPRLRRLKLTGYPTSQAIETNRLQSRDCTGRITPCCYCSRSRRKYR